MEPIIHVEIKSTGEHKYFGSVKAIYTKLSEESVGTSYDALIRRGFTKDPNRFENDKCIIRRGEIIRMNSQEVKDRLISL